MIKLANEIKNKGTEKGVADFNLFGSQQNLNKTTVELQKAMQDIANGSYTAMDGFVSLAGTLTSLGYAIQRVSNLWKTLNDTQASGSQKTIALLTTLGPALNAIKGALNTKTLIALGSIGTSLLPLDAAAKDAASSVTTLGGAITALGPQIGIGVALIGMLVGAIGLIVTLSQNAKRALEQIKTAATNFTSDLNELQSSASELKNEFTNYNEIYNQLRNCAQGSSEWKENMSQLVEQTNDLLDTYPILQKYKSLLEPNAQGNLIWSQETIDKTIIRI